jgi:hypothetical protein
MCLNLQEINNRTVVLVQRIPGGVQRGHLRHLSGHSIDNPEKRAANRKVWVALALFNDQLRLPLNNLEDAGERLGKSIRVQYSTWKSFAAA